jgi:hypothetical protein
MGAQGNLFFKRSGFGCLGRKSAVRGEIPAL